MKEFIWWIIGAGLLCLGGWQAYRLRRKKPYLYREKEQEETREAKPEAPQEKKQEPEVPTGPQRLLAQLAAQRREMAALRYRQDCGALFAEMSSGIQDLLAQEKRPCPQDRVFCRRLVVSAENESLRSKMEQRPVREQPEPISAEIQAADEATLQEIIRVEKSKVPIPVVEIGWDTLMEALLPCVEGLLRAAEENRAGECRQALTELQAILAASGISPVWYSDARVQKDPDMQRNYRSAKSYPVPALYYGTGEQAIAVSGPGYTGITKQREELQDDHD